MQKLTKRDKKNIYYCPHLCCCHRDVSAIVPSGLHQVLGDLGNFQELSN